jgi:tetratricopeptide (TPR) repeat protein
VFVTYLQSSQLMIQLLLKGKSQLALEDYIYANLLQQLKNEPPSNQAKVESIVKEIARKGADNLFRTMRAAPGVRGLPSKSHCRNFLESYPSPHQWVPHYRGQERGDLEAALNEARREAAEEYAAGAGEVDNRAVGVSSAIASAVDPDLRVRQRALDLVCFDLVHNRFADAFELLASVPVPDALPTGSDALEPTLPLMFLSPFEEAFRTNSEVLLSLQFELLGMEKHLRCDLDGARQDYDRSLRYYPNNIDARIKLANAHLEVPDLKATEKVLNTLMAHFEVLDKQNETVAIMMAWTILHRVSMYVTR